MKKKIITLLGILLLLSLYIQAQHFPAISGMVKRDSVDQPVEGAIIILLKPGSATPAKTAISDNSGNFILENIKPGTYRLKITHIQYIDYLIDSIIIQEQTPLVRTNNILLKKREGTLQDITVKTQKPFIQMLDDRIAINIEGNIQSTGSTSLEIFERLPGVSVDGNDNISLRGKNGVIILVDGKRVPLTGQDLANFLRSIAASSIERIDLITSTSAKYDAAGNAGFIDIRLKKDQRMGLNGTFTAGMGQGVRNKQNAASTMNYRSKKINLYGNVNYNRSEPYNHIFAVRDFYENNIYAGSYNQDNDITRIINTLTGRLGLDLFMSKKTTLGFLLSGNKNMQNRGGHNISIVSNNSHVETSTFATETAGTENSDYIMSNINLKQVLGGTGKELSVDVDYAKYGRNVYLDYVTRYNNLSGQQILPDYITNSNQNGFSHIKSFKIDLQNPKGKKVKIEGGLKMSEIKTDANVAFRDRSNGGNTLDSSKSNHFIYTETNNAAYVVAYAKINKVNMQIGLRAEQTHALADQIFTKEKLDTSYLQFFPSLSVNLALTDKKSIGLKLTRSIERPTFGQLNPFKNFIDPSLFASGAPYLLPAITKTADLSFNFGQPSLLLTYSHTKNPIFSIFRTTDNQSKVIINIPVNLDYMDYLAGTLIMPYRIAPWWNTVNTINVYYSNYSGSVGQTIINEDNINTQISIINTVKLKNNYNAELGFNFSSGDNFGISKTRSQSILSAGIQKSFWNNRASLRLNISDILFRQWPRVESTQVNYRDTWYALRDTRVLSIAFTYKFGGTGVLNPRQRTTASEEERRRVN